MDDIAALLRQWAAEPGSWSLAHSSVVVQAEARSAASYPTAAEAFAEARRFVAEIAGATPYFLVNRADLGAHSDEVLSETHGWQAAIDVCLTSDADRDEQSHFPINGA